MPAFRDSLIKSLYQKFLSAPSVHTHSAFVSMCASELQWHEQQVKEKLKDLDWYTPNE